MTAPYVPDAVRDLGALIPEVADSVRSLQAAAQAQGIKLQPIETRRSQERQDALYEQGRGRPGPVVTWTLHSNHTPGAAVDFLVNGDMSGSDPGYQWLQQNAPKYGFGVLGSKDPGHVEMPGAVQRASGDGVVQQAVQQGTEQAPSVSRLPAPAPWMEQSLAEVANSRIAHGEDPKVVTADLGKMVTQLRALRAAPRDTVPPPQGPSPAPIPKSIEQHIAEQANDAIVRGADPKAVTSRLGMLVQFFRSNPDALKQANNALSQGADPVAVSRRTYELAQKAPQTPQTPSQPEQSSVDERSPAYNAANTLTSALTFGLGPKIGALAPAISDVVHGRDSFGHSYAKNVNSDQAGINQFANEHPVISGAENVAGTVGNIAATPTILANLGIRAVEPVIADAASNATQAVKSARQKIADMIDALASGGGKGVQTMRANAAAGAAGRLAGAPATGDVGDQFKEAGKGAAAGVGLGALASIVNHTGDLANLAGRAKSATPLDEAADALDKQITASTRANYGKAEAEGAGKAATPKVKESFGDPDIKPYVDQVRNSRKYGSADDATVGQKAYTLMSKQAGAFQKILSDPEKWNAETQLKYDDLRLAQQKLKADLAAPSPTDAPMFETAQSPNPTLREGLQNYREQITQSAKRTQPETAAQRTARESLERKDAEIQAGPRTGASTRETIPGMMPSFPEAVAEKARMEGERGAFTNASDAASRIMKASSIRGRKLLTQSKQAFSNDIEKMSPGQAEQATQAVLGRVKEIASPTPSLNYKTGFGVGQPLARLNRISPFVDALDQTTGRTPALPAEQLPILQELLLNYLSRPASR